MNLKITLLRYNWHKSCTHLLVKCTTWRFHKHIHHETTTIRKMNKPVTRQKPWCSLLPTPPGIPSTFSYQKLVCTSYNPTKWNHGACAIIVWFLSFSKRLRFLHMVAGVCGLFLLLFSNISLYGQNMAVCPFTCWQTSGLSPDSGYHESSCHGQVQVCADTCSPFS